MMEVRFSGAARVDVAFRSFTIPTDQPRESGGEDSAPSPFDLFLASLAACAGYYAQRFCQERGIPTEGLAVSLGVERDPGAKRLSKIRIEVALPESFPEKYRGAVLRAVDQCSVKRHIVEPPILEVTSRARAS
jgi:putative redox protein